MNFGELAWAKTAAAAAGSLCVGIGYYKTAAVQVFFVVYCGTGEILTAH